MPPTPGTASPSSSSEKHKRSAEFSAAGVVSELEKANGVRPKVGMTMEEQVAAFPQLKDAPTEGAWTKNVKLVCVCVCVSLGLLCFLFLLICCVCVCRQNFNPLGQVIRRVRCLRCKEWGHQCVPVMGVAKCLRKA